MKVVQVIDQLNVGGAERVLVDLSNLLHEKNVDVTVLCLLGAAKLDSYLHKEIKVIYLHRKNKYNPIYLIRLYRLLRQYDVIHIHLRQVLRYVSLLFYGFNLHKKHIVVFHDHFGNINTAPQISRSIKYALRQCSAYIGVSGQLVNWAKANTVNAKIFKLPNVVRSMGAIETDLKLTAKETQVVSVGNFRPQKNYEFLCQLVAAGPSDYHYTIYGQIVDNVYYKDIKALIHELNLTERISIITDCDSIQTQLPKYHLGLHCAKSETGPLVAIEYLSVPIPFIAYNTGEVAKDVKVHFPSLIQDDFDTKNWIENMERILEKREALLSELKPFYRNHYSEEAYVEECVNLYRNLLMS